jgi:hypothetical protein
MVKKIIIGVVVLLVVVAGGLFYLYSNLGSYIKAAIETYGSQATQAKVTVDSVKLSATDGQGSISGLVIGNPAGFNGPQSMSLGLVSLTVDTGSITQNPVIIKQVVINAPQVNYERSGLTTGNLEKIRDNVTSYTNAQRGQPSGGSPQPSPGPSTGGAPPPAEKDARKVIINELSIRDGKVSVSATQLQGRTLSANLPAIQLHDIGKAKGGATPAEVAQAVLGAITNEASKVAVAELQKSLGNIGGAVQERLQGVNPGGAADQLRGILGGNK